MTDPHETGDWHLTQLSFGSAQDRFHSHSYYDIPVMDDAGRRIVAYRTTFTGRHPTPRDRVEIGLLDAAAPGDWQRLGESAAWSWQQGPMAQWIPGHRAVVWNDRDPTGFVARVVDLDGSAPLTLSRPVYGLDPGGRFALSLDMGRLEHLRPGYGYAVDGGATPEPSPVESGIWKTPLDGGAPTLLLSLDAARAWLMPLLPLKARAVHAWRRYHYWFNHVKLSPDGARFTVKLRWRKPGGPWTNAQGVSLTGSVLGGDLRLLADATSHVIWQTADRLYFWREGELSLYRDTAPRGTRLGRIGAGRIDGNVHLRHLPPGPCATPAAYVFDTPYRETIDLALLDGGPGAPTRIARFHGHEPVRGPFRCDLHPVPSADGRRIVVTSLRDGGRQVYLLERRA